MTKDEALKLALEALKKFHYAMIDAGVLDRQEVLNEGFTAATAIKEALAQQDVQYTGNGTAGRETDVKPTGFFFQMLKPEQEPVACIEYIPCCTDKTCPKCKATTPPQRTWVGLTDEEIDYIYTGIRAVHHDVDSDVLCRAIEAKLKEKNT